MRTINGLAMRTTRFHSALDSKDNIGRHCHRHPPRSRVISFAWTYQARTRSDFYFLKVLYVNQNHVWKRLRFFVSVQVAGLLDWISGVMKRSNFEGKGPTAEDEDGTQCSPATKGEAADGLPSAKQGQFSRRSKVMHAILSCTLAAFG